MSNPNQLKRSGLLVAGILLAGLVAGGGVPPELTRDLLAHFRFGGDGKDASSHCADADLKSTRFERNSIYLSGAYENGGGEPDAFRAIAGIPGLSYEAFTLSLDFLPSDFEPAKSASRLGNMIRMVCYWTGIKPPSLDHSGHEPIIVGGSSYRWLSYRHKDGCLELTLNNQDFVYRFTNVIVSAGQWHNLICAFDLRGQKVKTFLDGRKLPEVKLPEDFVLRVMDSDRKEEDKEFTFSNYSDGTAFHGYAANLKLFGLAVVEPGIAELYAASLAERPAFNPILERSENGLLRLLPLLILAAAVLVWFKHCKRHTAADCCVVKEEIHQGDTEAQSKETTSNKCRTGSAAKPDRRPPTDKL